MNPRRTRRGSAILSPRLRVLCDGETALGPGRVELLEFVDVTGSLRSAAARMGMSYMRAWTIVKSLNAWFDQPLIEFVRGGRAGGGAKLTDAGRKAVLLYRRMEQGSQRAMHRTWKDLRKLLKT